MKTELSRVKPPATGGLTCLTTKLAHFLPLTPLERDLLHSLEGKNRHCRRGQLVWRQGEEADSLYVIQSGWMYGYAILPDGRRQVLDIYCPGDILGLRDIVFDYSVSAVAAITEATLCPFPKTAMDDVFVASPRLATLLYSLGMLENRVVIDRLKMATCLDAREVICFFLLQIYSRLSVTNPNLGNQFELPLTQELIGDALGLTQVHVNRTIRRLEEEKLIRREGHEITFLDLNAIRKISTFEDRYYKIDTTWFPN